MPPEHGAEADCLAVQLEHLTEYVRLLDPFDDPAVVHAHMA